MAQTPLAWTYAPQSVFTNPVRELLPLINASLPLLVPLDETYVCYTKIDYITVCCKHQRQITCNLRYCFSSCRGMARAANMGVILHTANSSLHQQETTHENSSVDCSPRTVLNLKFFKTKPCDVPLYK